MGMYYQRLRDLREDKDLTQEEVGKILFTSKQQYYLYESGKREIPFHMAKILAEFYDVSLDYIAGRTNDKKGMYYPKLLPEENRIINKYRSLSEKNKGRLIERLSMLSGKKQ